MAELICGALVAVLAVFGGYVLIRLFAETFFGHEAILTAVELKTRADIEELPALLLEAEGRLSPGRSRQIYLLVPEELCRDPEARAQIREAAQGKMVMICPVVGFL